MAYKQIKFDVQDRVALLTINRPEKRNALNLETRGEIAQVLDRLSGTTEVGCLVVTGAGDKAFIAGSDLTELSKMSPLEVHAFASTAGQRLYTRFEQLDIPVIAMINGLCLGGGLEVAMACDIRLAADCARLGQPEIHLGIIPGSGGTQRLPALVGQGRAREMVFTGDPVSAHRALEMGLVNRIWPQAELYEKTFELASRMAAKSRTALKMAKRTMILGQDSGLTAGLACEALAQAAVFSSPDRTEGMAAFFDKRKPVFNR
ncbi:MAG: enoyl-CoA hydratase-related protein [Desulfobacterales bacterium]|nr:enoyl-CoA hydratase-related protein [Desulfobacterales bacterium]